MSAIRLVAEGPSSGGLSESLAEADRCGAMSSGRAFRTGPDGPRSPSRAFQRRRAAYFSSPITAMHWISIRKPGTASAETVICALAGGFLGKASLRTAANWAPFRASVR